MSRLSFLVIACCVLFVLAGGHAALAAPTSKIEGVAKDAQTGDVLPGANVAIVGTSYGASTDIYGHFIIRNVPAGSYRIRATYVGYETVTKPIQITDGVDAKQDFALTAVGVIGETVVVTAQAQGQTEAINQQLASQAIVNVVSSARIQELPDANAAESVGRLPGVSILRSGGEGNQIVIRGLAPKYSAVMVDGVRMSSSNPNDRSVDLSMISPLSLEGIEVSKSVTPDQDADVLGGTVNFKMREAKGDQPGFAFSGLAQGGYNGLTASSNKHNNYKLVVSFEGRILEQSLGLFAQADLERRNLSSNEFGASYFPLGNSHIDYITTGLNLNDVARDRQRANGTLVMDYVLPQGKITLSNFLSSGTTDIQNRGEFFNIASNIHNSSFGYSNNKLTLITNSLNIEHDLSIFHANLKLSHAYSESSNPDDWTATFQQAPAGLSSFINKANILPTSIPPAAIIDPTASFLNSLVSSSSFFRERSLTAALDLSTNLSLLDQLTSVVKFGGKYRYQNRSYVRDQYTGQGMGLTSAKLVDSLIASHFPSTRQYSNTTSLPVGPFLDPGFDYNGFLNGDYTMRFPLSYGMLAEMAHFVRNNPTILNTPNLTYFHDNFNSTGSNYDGFEKQSALYAMATFQIGEDITFIPGVRYQDLKTTYTAPRGIQTTASSLGGPYRHYDTTLTADHAYWLPALILRYKPLSWFDVRLSYTNSISYPDYIAIIPRIDVPVGSSITYNNYQLNPSRSTNYDVYFSFYDNSIGLFTAGGFLKRITDLIYPRSFYVTDAAALPYYPPNMGATTPNGVYNINTYVNDPYRIDNYGMELDWQTHFWYLPHPFDGLVMNINFTHIFSKAQYQFTDVQKVGRTLVYVDTSYTDRLLSQPNNVLNLSLGYDYDGFSIRVSMLYTADVFSITSYWDQLRASTSAYTRWDLSAKQSLPWGIQVYGDLNNMNAASDIVVINGATSAVPQSQQSYGLSGDIGVRWNF